MGARGSQQATCPAETIEKPLAPALSEASSAPPAVEPLVPAISEVGDAEYHEVLAQCAELRRTRQELLQVKLQVRTTIDQFARAFSGQGSDTSECCLGDAAVLGAEQERPEVEPPSYDEALAEREELEDEVESLRETLDTTSAMVASIMQQSQELSDHLEDVGNLIHLPTEVPAKVAPDASMTLLDMSLLQMAVPVATHPTLTSTADETSVPVCSRKMKQDRMKLPSLKLAPLAGDHLQPGSSGSEASSSTATPRSEHSLGSRMASARSETNACCCEDA